jgi:Protein of unknown function (DUF742)
VSVPSHHDRVPAGDGRHLPPDDNEPAEDDEDFLVRPYAVTQGRTEPRYKLEIEAIVETNRYDPRELPLLSPECRAIMEFCQNWRSVAEVSAVLQMPLGVARILIADLAMEGLVRIHQLDHTQGRMDVNLLERVLSGLRKL